MIKYNFEVKDYDLATSLHEAILNKEFQLKVEDTKFPGANDKNIEIYYVNTFDHQFLRQEVLVKEAESATNIITELQVREMLNYYQLSPKMLGYHYLVEGIVLLMQRGINTFSLNKEIYQLLAEKHNSNIKNIEHNIRNSIAAAWSLAEDNNIHKQFNTKPSNLEFMQGVVSDIYTKILEKSVNYKELL